MPDKRDVQAAREWLRAQGMGRMHSEALEIPLAAEYSRVRAETLDRAAKAIASAERPKGKGVHSYSFAKARWVFTRAIQALAQPAPQQEEHDDTCQENAQGCICSPPWPKLR